VTTARKPSAKKPAHLRVEIRLQGGPAAKVFTSLGPARQGSVIDLPAVEAEGLIDADRAVLTNKPFNVVPLEGTYRQEQSFAQKQ